MKLNRFFKSSVAVALALTATTAFADIASAEEAAPSTDVAAAAQVQNTYKYTSQQYGYSIKLPNKPLGVIPAKVFFGEGAEGEVLVFKNEGYNVLKGWVVLVNAFSPEDIPDNLLQLNDQERQQAVENFGKRGLFDKINVCEMANGKSGFYCMSAREIEHDSDGDGVADEILVSDKQTVMTYFKGDYGGCMMLGLMESPDLTQQSMAEYEQGILSFQQWPTTFNND